MPTYQSPGVYVEEVESGARPIEGVGTAVAAFVGFAARGPLNEPILVTNWNQYVNNFGDFVPGAFLASAVYGFFANGGGRCYVIRVGDPLVSSNGAAPEPVAGPPAQLGQYKVRALPGVSGEITLEVMAAEGDNPPDGAFKLTVSRDGKVEETYPSVITRRGKDNVVNQVRERSRLITFEETVGASKPEPQTVAVPTSGPPAVREPLSAGEYVGDPEARTGFGSLVAVDDVTMVAVPDLMTAFQSGAIDQETLIAVQQGLITHCELMGNRIAILDTPPGLNAQEVHNWRKNVTRFDSKYAALYYPWIKVYDPATRRPAFVPPSGHVAGIWARNDDTRGVHKAPANEVVRGAVELEYQITKGEHDLLNPDGVNCIRAFPGRGIRIWGARTLSSDAAWRYLNVRRLFNYLEDSILNATQWVVFEPNDEALWARIRRTISAFLVNEWRKGALFGLTPDDSFYVKCDTETNPTESIDLGQVICEIGVAPVKPAEFVVFRLAQISGGTAEIAE
jgi:Bacteriophage tail sheath protein